MTSRRRDLLSLATLSLAALILGHHLVFLTAYGRSYWAMLERTGHGPVWAITVATVASTKNDPVRTTYLPAWWLARYIVSAGGRSSTVFIAES